jgi:hypothetical protein
MAKLNKAKAIELAAKDVGAVHYIGGGYGYRTYSRRHNAWWGSSYARPYNVAVADRADWIAKNAAALLLDCSLDEISDTSYPCGSVQHRLNQYLLSNSCA